MPQSRQGPTRFQHQYFRLLLATEASARPTIPGHAIGYDTSSLMCVVTRPSRCTESSDRPLVTIHKKSNDRRTHPPRFRLAASVSWVWSWEKEGRAVEVVPGIQAVHRKFLCAQLPEPVQTARLGRVFLRRFVFCVFICVSLICLHVLILLCFREQLSHLPYSFWR